MKKIMKKLICLFKGHQPVYWYWDTADGSFSNGICLRCSCIVKAPERKKVNNCLPKIN